MPEVRVYFGDKWFMVPPEFVASGETEGVRWSGSFSVSDGRVAIDSITIEFDPPKHPLEVQRVPWSLITLAAAEQVRGA